MVKRKQPQRLLPFVDYQRIYEVIYSVLEASEIAMTHRACLFFASAGTLILRRFYDLPAEISVGGAALMVDEQKANVIVYGRDRDGLFVGEQDAFHAWVECDGWFIDFMAPILGAALREDGVDWKVPRYMLQKPLAEGKLAVGDIQHAGEFCLSHDSQLANDLMDEQRVLFDDLLNICQAWFRRPPKALPAVGMAGNKGFAERRLVLRAPPIEGSW